MPKIYGTIAHRIANDAYEEIDPVDLCSDGALTLQQALAFTATSETQFRRHVESGAIPYVRDGSARRIRSAELKPL